MCFAVKEGSQKQIAQEDIECYKVCRILHNKINSPYYEYIWEEGTKESEIGELQESGILNEGNTSWYKVIRKGFHSCNTLKSANLVHSYAEDILFAIPNLTLSIFKFVIPKGAEYWENDGERVSNKIYLQSTIPIYDKRTAEAGAVTI